MIIGQFLIDISPDKSDSQDTAEQLLKVTINTKNSKYTGNHIFHIIKVEKKKLKDSEATKSRYQSSIHQTITQC
jgi:hypothetical protein